MDPTNPTPGISPELIHELAQREVAQRLAQADWPQQPAWTPDAPATPGGGAVSPTTALLAGGLADAASTYTFLKRGTGMEDNAMFGGLNNSPEAVGLTLLGQTAGAYGLKKLLERGGLKRLANTLAGGLGAYQTGLAANNLGLTARRDTSAEHTNRQFREAIIGPRR